MAMYKFKISKYCILLGLCLVVISCKVPDVKVPEPNVSLPDSFNKSTDETNISDVQWRRFFNDSDLIDLIDSALKNNHDLAIILEQIEIAKNDIRVKKGDLLPTVGLMTNPNIQKFGYYTANGVGNATTEILPGKRVPEILHNYDLSIYSSWQVDVWKKLSNSKKAAVNRYLSTIEGKNFVITNLISEIANSYYELLAYDNQLEIIRQNITIQKNALEIVKIQKESAKATELAVQKFEAEVLSSRSMEFDVLLKIEETENKINFLLARYPQKIKRDTKNFLKILPSEIKSGIPSQLLANRPDIKQAELELMATKLDVKVARADFYPSLRISASLGLEAFQPSYLLKYPESLLFSFMGNVFAPLVNKNAIKAEYNKANSRQIQALYNYERTILNAYFEVLNQLSRIENMHKIFDLKEKRVVALDQSIAASNDLFRSARVDYFEVLMTQRDALQAKIDLIDTQKELINSTVNIYKSLGGGWK